MRALWLVPLLASAACTAARPSYMADSPRTEEDVRRIVDGIRAELGADFTIERSEEIFFVASNGSASGLKEAHSTLSRMMGHLYSGYFEKRPTVPIRVYLFRDRESYDAYCRKTYQEPPSTPFGFYMAGERKMVMNISTGTGTLAHEIVHPLIAEDFPRDPHWFNEGFASLYEQSRPQGKRMIGLVNWRLPRLQRALREKRPVPLSRLFTLDGDEFYGEARDLNYATARYLCLYLQEKGLLEPFYKEYRKDPSGPAILEKVTASTLETLETEWSGWVLGLKYENR